MPVGCDEFGGKKKQRPATCLMARHQQRQQLRREARRHPARSRVENTVLAADLVTKIADIRHCNLRLSCKDIDDFGPIDAGIVRSVDAADRDPFVDQFALAVTADVNRKALGPADRRYPARTLGARGRFDHRYRSDFLPREPRLVDKKVHVRLEKPTGAKLDNAPCHSISLRLLGP